MRRRCQLPDSLALTLKDPVSPSPTSLFDESIENETPIASPEPSVASPVSSSGESIASSCLVPSWSWKTNCG